jgi:hypothetical protein
VSVEVLIAIVVAAWGLALLVIIGLCAASASLDRATRRQVLRAVPSPQRGRMLAAAAAYARPRRSRRARRGGLHAA